MAKKLINKTRVIIPKNPKEELDLSNSIITKEAALGPASPIHALNWAGQATVVTDALNHYIQSEELRAQAEKEMELCKVALVGIDDLIKQSRDILKGVYRQTPHLLSDWGFEVNASPENSGKVKPA